MTSSSKQVAMEEQARVEESAVVSGLFGRDMIYLGFWGMQIIIAAALTPVTTRLMGKTEYGEAAAAVAVMQLLNALFSFSLYTAVQRAYAADDGEERARHLVTLAIGLAVLTGTITYATGRWWCPLFGLGHFPTAVRYGVLWAVMSAITGPSLGLVRSRDHLRGFVAASFTQSVIAQVLALCLVILVRATAAEYILGQLLGEIGTALIALSIARPKVFRRRHVPMLRESLRFSIALVPASIAGFLFDASDRIVVHGDLGASALGRYSVARNVGGFVLVLLQLLNFVWMPRLFAIKDEEQRRNILARSRDGIYILAVLFAIAVATASPLLLRLWAPPSYRPQSLLLVTALVAAAGLLFADSMIYTQVLILRGRTKTVAIGSALTALLNLGLNVLLVPILGIDGSAGITCFCYGFGCLWVRWLAGAAGPVTNARPLAYAIAGEAVCLGSAAAPADGVALAFRLLVAAAATIGFFIQMLALIRPENYQALRGRFLS